MSAFNCAWVTWKTFIDFYLEILMADLSTLTANDLAQKWLTLVRLSRLKTCQVLFAFSEGSSKAIHTRLSTAKASVYQ